MMTRKMNFANLANYRVIITLKEPDWKKIFEVYLNLDMIRYFLTEEEILSNKNKGIVKKTITPLTTQTKTQDTAIPGSYSPINPNTIGQQQFYHFVRGLYFELGIGLTRADPYKAYEAYCQGFNTNNDGLCAFKIATILTCKTNKVATKVELDKGIFFLVIAAVVVEMQYSGMMNEIRSEMVRIMDLFDEGIRLCETVINKFGGTCFSSDIRSLYIGLFEFQYCQSMQAQEKYQRLLMILENRIKASGDHTALFYIFQLLCLRNSIHDKNIKQIIDIISSAKKECLHATFSWILREMNLLKTGGKDNQFFYNIRSIFYEMYSYFKFFYEKVWSNTQQFVSPQQQQINQLTGSQLGSPVSTKKEIWPIIYAINSSLYEKKTLLLNQSLHYSMTIRIHSEFFEKGQGLNPDLNQALAIIQEELNMSKEFDYLYAYANYACAKLKRKLPQFSQQEVDMQFQKSKQQFEQRLQTSNNPNAPPGSNVTGLVYIYYLARISQIWANNFQEYQARYNDALHLYILERQKFKNVKTLQFEIICLKIEKRMQQIGKASLYFGNAQINIPQSGLAHSSAYPQDNNLLFQSNNNMNSNLLASNAMMASSNVQPYNQQLQLMNSQINASPNNINNSNINRSISPTPLNNMNNSLINNNPNVNMSNIYQSNANGLPITTATPMQGTTGIPLNMTPTPNMNSSLIQSTHLNNNPMNGSTVLNDYSQAQQLVGRNPTNLQSSPNGLLNSQVNSSDLLQQQSFPVKPSGIGMRASTSQQFSQHSQQMSRQLTQPHEQQQQQYVDPSAHPMESSQHRVTFYNPELENASPQRQLNSQTSNLQGTPSQRSIQGGIPSGQQLSTSRILSNSTGQFQIDRRIMDKLTSLKTTRSFIDPSNLIILDFLHRGSTYSTSEGVILTSQQQKYYNNNSQDAHVNGNFLVSQDKLSKLRSFKKHMLQNEEDRAILDGEPIVLKQFNCNDVKEVTDLFSYLDSQEKKVQKLPTAQSKYLVPVKAFSFQSISPNVVAIYLIYPSQSFNLYGAMKRNPPLTLLEKLLIGSQICDVISQLHSCSVFPLNLKPSNILFDHRKTPYLSGWEIQRIAKQVSAEENLNDDESDEKLQFTVGYTAPEIMNAKTTLQTTNRSITSMFFGTSTQLGTSSSDVWSTGMILMYLFFGIDAGEQNFCRDKQIYSGFNLVISEYTTGSHLFLDRTKELIESMAQFKPEARPSMQVASKTFQRLYQELSTQMKGFPQGQTQQHFMQSVIQPNIGMSRTHQSPYRSNLAASQLQNNNYTTPFNAITASAAAAASTLPTQHGNYNNNTYADYNNTSPFRNDQQRAYTNQDLYTSPIQARNGIPNTDNFGNYRNNQFIDPNLSHRSMGSLYDPYTNPNLSTNPKLPPPSQSQMYPRSPNSYSANRSISPHYF